MIATIADRLTAAVPHLPEEFRAANAGFFRPDLVERLAIRLAGFTAAGQAPDRRPPHFAGEVTPPVGPAFAPFAGVLDMDDPERWAGAIAAAGADGLLLLLGQRRTPASLTDARAVPPALEPLLLAAGTSCHPGGRLTVVGRAWAKHVPRAGDGFWGTVPGGDREKNVAAGQLLGTILGGATWWNVYGHCRHGTVYEVRLPSGHGARWGLGGRVFIGFLEPFEKATGV